MTELKHTLASGLSVEFVVVLKVILIHANIETILITFTSQLVNFSPIEFMQCEPEILRTYYLCKMIRENYCCSWT